MKKLFVGVSLAFCCSAGVLTITAARHAPTIRPNVSIAGVKLGGLTVEEASRELRIWWETEKLKKLKLRCGLIQTQLPEMKPSELGVELDDVASVNRLPVQDVLSDAKALVDRDEFPDQSFEPLFKSTGNPPLQLEELVAKQIGKPRPARVLLLKGQIIRQPELNGESLDEAGLVDAVAKAFKNGAPVELPLTNAAKHVSDEQLAQITGVVSSYTTRFPRGQYNRCSNIKLASSHLNGVVLLPGEQMSFNKTVGERTLKGGFKIAGVYKNGKHDTGIGGGICQVSTTLYNAALFGDMTIVHRSNHSMPVAYVPLGRDATVDYGSLDLVVQNDSLTPIAISSLYRPGSLTFRVLGKSDPARSIKIIQVGSRSWDTGTEVVHDPKLKPGEKVVVERGSMGHSIRTYRLIYQNGVLVTKQPLGYSYYGGGDRIIAVGPTEPRPMAAPSVPTTKVTPAVRPAFVGG